MSKVRFVPAPALLLAAAAAGAAPAAAPKQSAAYERLELVLDVAAREVERDGARPTILSRAMAVAVTAMFDAWAAYDPKALGTRTGARLRRPARERTAANKAKAISYAAYRALLDLYPEDAPYIREQMAMAGYDPDDASTDPARPQGVGNLAAAAVIADRRHDGANQHGDEVGSDGTPYGDYTYYQPVNTVQSVRDLDRWQPIPFDDGKGGTVAPGFLTPHWYRVRPFALGRSDRFRPPPPPKWGSAQLQREVEEVLAFNATLTPEQKATVEFMRDGPRSTGQSGHWLRFAQAVARRDGSELDRDIKLFFAVANTAFDAFIAAWEAKRFYDSSRPWTLVRAYHKGEKVRGWAGPGKGVVPLPAEEWRPYSPATFVTPPFPGYVSGHSTVSGACAKALELFTGSDRFGEVEVRRAGGITEPAFDCPTIEQQDGRPLAGASCEVSLPMPTFTATAEMAGISRVMGGYHIQADNVAGLELGRQVAQVVWARARSFWEGTARVEDGPAPARDAGAGKAEGSPR